MEELELLAAYERRVGDLYETYGNLFEEYREFWHGLASEEVQHSLWALNLIEKLNTHKLTLKENPWRVTAIKTAQGYVDKQIERAKAGQVDHVAALSIALDLEKSMLEKDIFAHYGSDKPMTKELLNKLQTETEHHRRKLELMWEGARKKETE